MTFSSGKLSRLESVIYVVMWILTNLLIYRMNDESQPLIGIFRLGYLIPCLIYSGLTVLISFVFLQTLKIFLNRRTIAFCAAIVIGIPVGIVCVFHLASWLFR